jgi:hypothetical protein
VKRNFFPPGAIRLKKISKENKPKNKRKLRSKWREFEFIFMTVRNAIVPHIGINHLIEYWPRIRDSLSENHRKRKLQIDSLKSILGNS